MHSLLTLTTAAPDLTLLTLAERRVAVGLASTDTSRDDDLLSLERRVDAVISETCNVARAGVAPPTLREETLTETFRGLCRTECLQLARFPVSSVTSITVDGIELTASEFEVDIPTGQVYRLSSDTRVPWNASKVVAVYAAGWATVPFELATAAAKLMAVLWHEGQRSDPNLRSEEIPGVLTRSWWVGPKDDPAVPTEILELLAPFNNPSVA